MGIHAPQPALHQAPLLSPSKPSPGPGGKRKVAESGNATEEKKRSKVTPLSPCYLSIVGIGVDLSVRTVQAVSSIPGAKYCSVLSCNEFISSVAQEFTYDVLPIAFDINFALSRGISFQKIFGSSELNDIAFPTRQGLSPICPAPESATQFVLNLCRSNDFLGVPLPHDRRQRQRRHLFNASQCCPRCAKWIVVIHVESNRRQRP
jgi:hypothetical protein